MGGDSVFGRATRYTLDDSGGLETQRQPTRPGRSWGPPSLLYNSYRVSFLGITRPGHGVDHPPHLAQGYPPLCHCTFIECCGRPVPIIRYEPGYVSQQSQLGGSRPGFHWRWTQELFQTDSTAHTDFYPLSTFGFIAGVKAPGEWCWPPAFICRWG